MPYAQWTTCKSCGLQGVRRAGVYNLSRRGLCKKCSHGKVINGARQGGCSGVGGMKKRSGSCNGRFLPQISRHRTWRGIGLCIEDFEYLLRKLHSGREQGHPRPWLGKACLPQRFYSIPKLNEILEAMSTTRFCHIDRFRDAVSLELQDVVKQARSDYWLGIPSNTFSLSDLGYQVGYHCQAWLTPIVGELTLNPGPG